MPKRSSGMPPTFIFTTLPSTGSERAEGLDVGELDIGGASEPIVSDESKLLGATLEDLS